MNKTYKTHKIYKIYKIHKIYKIYKIYIYTPICQNKAYGGVLILYKLYLAYYVIIK